MLKKLKDECYIVMGQSPSSEFYNKNEDGIPFLQGRKTFGDKYPKIDTWTTKPSKIGCKNSVLMSVRAPVGDVNIAPFDICIGRGLASIKMKNNNNQYLYYLLKNNIEKIKNKSSGTVFDSINRSDLENLVLNFNNENEQRKIGKILNDIDKKIELNNEINNNLSTLEKTIYNKFLKELDGVCQQKLGKLCNIKYGKGLPTTKIEIDGYPVYGGNGIIGYYHEYMYEKSQILISCRGAASGNVIISKPRSFVTNNSLILECDRKYHHYLKQYSLNNCYYEYATGSAQPQITIDNIKDIIINIPSDDMLEKINEQLEQLEKKYFSNLEEIVKLEQLRDTLLPKLMNGEIDLDSIEV